FPPVAVEFVLLRPALLQLLLDGLDLIVQGDHFGVAATQARGELALLELERREHGLGVARVAEDRDALERDVEPGHDREPLWAARAGRRDLLQLLFDDDLPELERGLRGDVGRDAQADARQLLLADARNLEMTSGR